MRQNRALAGRFKPSRLANSTSSIVELARTIATVLSSTSPCGATSRATPGIVFCSSLDSTKGRYRPCFRAKLIALHRLSKDHFSPSSPAFTTIPTCLINASNCSSVASRMRTGGPPATGISLMAIWRGFSRCKPFCSAFPALDVFGIVLSILSFVWCGKVKMFVILFHILR